MSSLDDDILTILVDGLALLIKQGKGREYWCSSRATADALIALDSSLPIGEFLHLRTDARRRLLAESEVMNATRSWKGEVWDTSVALLALANLRASKFQAASIQSRDWLLSKYLKTHAWNHEQWETLWALIALSRIPDPPMDIDFSPAVEWVISAIGKPVPGMLMNWSNTALFVLFTNSNCWSFSSTLEKKLEKERRACLNTILSESLNESDDDESLWTPEGWSNGLVLWALAEAAEQMPSEASEAKIVNWCKAKVCNGELNGEDLAFICMGLYKYLKRKWQTDSLSRESKLKEQIGDKLKLIIMDKPRTLTKHTYDGYWSIHIKGGLVRFGFYVLISAVLSAAILFSENKIGQWTSWLALIPGLVALIVTFADFRQMLPWSQSRRSPTFPDLDAEE